MLWCGGGAVGCGAAWCDEVCCRVVWFLYGVVMLRYGTAWHIIARNGRYGMKGYGTVKEGHERVWRGTVRYGMVWYGTVRYGTVRCGTEQYGTVQCGTVRYGAVRYGMVWCMVCFSTVYSGRQNFMTHIEISPIFKLM